MSPRENVILAIVLALFVILTPLVIFFSPLIGQWLSPLATPAGVLVFGSFALWLLWTFCTQGVWPALCRFGNWLGRP